MFIAGMLLLPVLLLAFLSVNNGKFRPSIDFFFFTLGSMFFLVMLYMLFVDPTVNSKEMLNEELKKEDIELIENEIVIKLKL